MNTIELQELVSNFVETKNNKIFDKIYHRIQKNLWRYIYRITNDTELANDIMQDAFLLAYKHIDQYNNEYKFTTWIWNIARNKAIYEMSQHQRHNKMFKSLDDVIGKEGRTSEYSTHKKMFLTYDDIVQREEEEYQDKIVYKVIDEIDKLPSKYKNILFDREIYGLTYEDLSIKYQMKTNTISCRIKRGRDRVRDRMKAYKDKQIII